MVERHQPLPTIPAAETDHAGRPAPHRCLIGSYEYLCQTGTAFTYSHTPFGKVVWHGRRKPTA